MPERIQPRRTKGYRMPPGTIKVDRSTRWGNPFRVGDEGVPDAASALRLFEKMIDDPRIAGAHDLFQFTPGRLRADLGGRNLACWCPIGAPCHADVLLRIANQGTDPSAEAESYRRGRQAGFNEAARIYSQVPVERVPTVKAVAS